MDQRIDSILKANVVSQDELDVKDKLLAAGLVVVDKNGKSSSSARLHTDGY
jgi:hypothetical protein